MHKIEIKRTRETIRLTVVQKPNDTPVVFDLGIAQAESFAEMLKVAARSASFEFQLTQG